MTALKLIKQKISFVKKELQNLQHIPFRDDEGNITPESCEKSLNSDWETISLIDELLLLEEELKYTKEEELMFA